MWVPTWVIAGVLVVFILSTRIGRDAIGWLLTGVFFVLIAPFQLYEFLNRPVEEVFPPKQKQTPAEKPQ